MTLRGFVISLIISLFVVSAIAISAAWMLSAFLPFWQTAGACALLIFTGAFLWHSQRERRFEVALAERVAKEAIFDERNVVGVVCPCNQNTIPMELYVNEPAEYVCDVCKNKFFVNVKIDPILQTEPINLDNAFQVFQQLKEQKSED